MADAKGKLEAGADDAPELRGPATQPTRDTAPDLSHSTLISGVSDPCPTARVPARGTAPARKGAGDTTLLSLPAPAERNELEFEDRLVDCERRLGALADRVQMLERTPPGSARQSEQRWLVWVVFLLALAVAWQVFQASR